MALRSFHEPDALRAARQLITETGMNLDAAAVAELAGKLAPALRYDSESLQLVVVSENGDPRIDVRNGAVVDVTPAEFIQALALAGQTSAQAPGHPFKGLTAAWIAENKARQAQRTAPAAPHNGPNPWSKATWNLSQQWTLENTNPTLANQLQQAAT